MKLASGLWLADITDAIGVATFDYRTGAVPEFTFDAVDRDRKLSRRGLLREGTTLTLEGDVWQVAAVERSYKGDDIWLTFTARSRLSRRLRNMTGKRTTGRPPAGVDHRASQEGRRQGGRRTRCRPNADRAKPGQTVLDVIASIASDTGVEWVEVDGVIYVGTPWWAFTEDLGLPTWNVRLDGKLPQLDTGNALAMLDFSSRSSADDRKNAAEAQLVVESRRGSRVRPWHLVNVLKADDADNGDWLVSGVGFDEVSGSASIDLLRPLKSSPKKASQGESQSTDSGLADLGGDLEPVKDSSYKDAPRPANWSGRSVAAILSIYRNNRGGLGGHSIVNGCLWYAQEIAGYPHIGRNPHVLWTMLPTSKRHANRNVVPGAVLLFRNSRVGHAVVYLGGGLSLSTDYPTTGKWSIGPADEIERSFGTLLGWYSP